MAQIFLNYKNKNLNFIKSASWRNFFGYEVLLDIWLDLATEAPRIMNYLTLKILKLKKNLKITTMRDLMISINREG